MITLEKVAYKGWNNCLRLSNGKVELITTTDVGPRVIRFAFLDDDNVFKEYEDDLGKMSGNKWRVYGGHRFWHAPEDLVRTYILDNDSIEYVWNQNKLTVIKVEEETSITKILEIALAEDENKVVVNHKLINNNLWSIKAAPWALSVMNEGGELFIPQEDFIPHSESLLPARTLALWHYSDLTDKRIKIDKHYFRIAQEPGNEQENKIGIYNSKGWGAYVHNNSIFTKIYQVFNHSDYTDLGSNTECFVNKDMLEFETLGEYKEIPANGGINQYREIWLLNKKDSFTNLRDITDEYFSKWK